MRGAHIAFGDAGPVRVHIDWGYQDNRLAVMWWRTIGSLYFDFSLEAQQAVEISSVWWDLGFGGPLFPLSLLRPFFSMYVPSVPGCNDASDTISETTLTGHWKRKLF